MSGLVQAEADGLREAMLALERGQLIAFPTDTVYALACKATEPAAVARFYDAKQRPPGQPAKHRRRSASCKTFSDVRRQSSR